MNTIRITLFVPLLMMLWLASCGSPQPTPRDHELVSEAKALDLAKATFSKTGRKVADYGVSIETDPTGQKWIAWFEKKGAYATTGGKHAVTVEKSTGMTVFLQGE